jgi:hypothetical protein
MVWHHRRKSIAAYWKQQKGYAKAESLLADKWPQKYNSSGHLSWNGRLYGRGIVDFFLTRPRIYYGTWGTALFQSVYKPDDSMFAPSYYIQRAAELEAMAKGITDLATREMCLDLARRFRDIANVKSVTQQSDIEVVQLAERMVGKPPRPDKH